MSKTTFYIVRHGQSKGNVDLKKTDSDPELTSLGIEQANKRKTELKQIVFDHVYSSHLRRAVQTTSILIEGLSLTHTVYEELEERKYGDFFVHPELERINQEIWEIEPTLTAEEWWKYTHPEIKGMESYKTLIDRFLIQLDRIANNHQNQTVLLVSHGDLMRSLLVYSKFGTHKEFTWEAIKNTGYMVINFEGGVLPEIITTVDIIKT